MSLWEPRRGPLWTFSMYAAKRFQDFGKHCEKGGMRAKCCASEACCRLSDAVQARDRQQGEAMHDEGKETFEWLRMDVGELRRGRPPSTSTARKRPEMAPNERAACLMPCGFGISTEQLPR